MSRRPSRSQLAKGARAKNARSASARAPIARGPESVDTMTIDRIAAGGDGVARVNGMAVFVPRTAPGDVAQVAYTTFAKHGRGRVLQLLTPSPARVEPACAHYVVDRCGGCQLQHLQESVQRETRQHIVRDTLARIGKRTIDVPDIVSGAQWGYRGRLTLTLKRKGSGWVGGLHPHDDASRIFALDRCEIAHPSLVHAWHAVRNVLRHEGTHSSEAWLPAADELRLGIRLAEHAGADAATDAPAGQATEVSTLGITLVVEGGAAWSTREAFTNAVQAADAHITAVWWIPAPLADTRRRADSPPMNDATAEFAPSAREALAFAQVNAQVADALRDYVFAQVTACTPQVVLDGYAGTGRLAARLSREGTRVVAIEADPAAAEVAVSLLGPASRSRVVCDTVEQALPQLEGWAARPDVVVINPPRRGVHPSITAWLEAEAQRRVRSVVYVSCDPATLARDLSRLPSWRVIAVQCFDMFPQTAHVETVCVLQRENA